MKFDANILDEFVAHPHFLFFFSLPIFNLAFSLDTPNKHRDERVNADQMKYEKRYKTRAKNAEKLEKPTSAREEKQ